jgi:hypothetical protein
MFECEEYSEPLWTKLESIINEMLAVNALGDNLHIRLHAYNIMYNCDIVGLETSRNDQIITLIQEIKRNMVYRRYVRCTERQRRVTYNNTRILAHILLNVSKTVGYMKSSGGNSSFLQELQLYVQNLI